MHTMISIIRELTMLNRGVRVPQYTTVTGAAPTVDTD
jgi:hypothetical protein